MTTVELLVIFITGLIPTWRTDACDRVFANETNRNYCITQQQEGYERATYFAETFTRNGERTNIDPFVGAAVAMREGSFQFDPCIHHIKKNQIDGTPRDITTVNDRDAGRIRRSICLNTCRSYYIISENEEEIVGDSCISFEVGTMQLTNHELMTPEATEVIDRYYPRAEGERRNRSEIRRLALLNHDMYFEIAFDVLENVRDRCCENDQECQSDWRQWIPGHNAGRCSGERFDYYLSQVKGHYDEGMTYLCSKAPEEAVCLTWQSEQQ